METSSGGGTLTGKRKRRCAALNIQSMPANRKNVKGNIKIFFMSEASSLP